jgi:hypothetical protein
MGTPTPPSHSSTNPRPPSLSPPRPCVWSPPCGLSHTPSVWGFDVMTSRLLSLVVYTVVLYTVVSQSDQYGFFVSFSTTLKQFLYWLMCKYGCLFLFANTVFLYTIYLILSVNVVGITKTVLHLSNCQQYTVLNNKLVGNSLTYLCTE